MSRGFSEEAALPSTYFIFATWFTEFLPMAPCLLIIGPRPEGLHLLQLLGCLVRHPLPLGEVTRVALCSLPMNLRPTLLLYEAPISRSVWRLLHASNSRSARIPEKRGLLSIFCAKAIYCGDGGDGGNFGDGTLHINLPPSRGGMPILGEKDEEEISEEFQARMLGYRCRNIGKVRESRFDLPDFTSRLRILARVLGAPIVDAPELHTDLRHFLSEYEEEARASRWSDLRCVAIEGLLHHCHKQPGEKLYVRELTVTVNAILKGRGETIQLTPRKIGAILKSVGLFTKRDASGCAVQLDNRACRHIHQRAHQFEVAAARGKMLLCSHWEETLGGAATGDQDTSKRRKG